MKIPPIMVRYGQDQGEIVGWTENSILVLLLGEETPIEVSADEVEVIQGFQRFDALRRLHNV